MAVYLSVLSSEVFRPCRSRIDILMTIIKNGHAHGAPLPFYRGSAVIRDGVAIFPCKWGSSAGIYINTGGTEVGGDVIRGISAFITLFLQSVLWPLKAGIGCAQHTPSCVVYASISEMCLSIEFACESTYQSTCLYQGLANSYERSETSLISKIMSLVFLNLYSTYSTVGLNR